SRIWPPRRGATWRASIRIRPRASITTRSGVLSRTEDPALPGRWHPTRARRSRLARAVARRLVAAAVVALIVVSITFVVVRLIPGNPAYLLAGGTTASAARVHQIERELGLDKPIPRQYVRFL